MRREAPAMITFGLLESQLGLIWETIGSAWSSSPSLCGGEQNPDENHSKPLNYI